MSARLRRRSVRREGFALPAVLWVLVGVAAVTLAGTLAARDAITAAQNRVDHARAAWRAEGCLEIARADLAEHLANEREANAAWLSLDSLLEAAPDVSTAGCAVTARPAGAVVDVNTADAERLRRALHALGASDERADSLTDAVLDWRDPDAAPRPSGAESDWYRAQRRLLPRNGPLANAAELRRVRGFADIEGLDTVFGVEPGRVPLGRAPFAVLASLPGFGDEIIARLEESRLRGQSPSDLLAFAATLSPDARATLLVNYPELVALVTAMPDAWVVTSHATEGPRRVGATIEVRLVRAGTRAAIVRRRTW